MKIVCLKHVPFEGPGAIADWAQERGHNLAPCDVFSGGGLPAPDEFEFLLVMGGPMSVHDEHEHPWLIEEKQFLGRAIESGKLVVGICLGAQLIAEALGASIAQGRQPEIGWFPIRRAPECPDWVSLPELLPVFHWHGETFSLPSGATLLASSAACVNQGFLYRDHVLALQCHLETTPQSLDALACACREELRAAPFIQDEETLRAATEEIYSPMQQSLFAMLDALVARASA